MSTPHPGEIPESPALARMLGRVKKLYSLQIWQERVLRREQELEAENARLRAELAVNQHLIQSYACALGLDPGQAPPPQLVMAWHMASPDDIPVAIDVGDVQWVLVVDGLPRAPNPAREYEDWQRIKAIYTRVDRQVNTLKAATLEGDAL